MKTMSHSPKTNILTQFMFSNLCISPNLPPKRSKVTWNKLNEMSPRCFRATNFMLNMRTDMIAMTSAETACSVREPNPHLPLTRRCSDRLSHTSAWYTYNAHFEDHKQKKMHSWCLKSFNHFQILAHSFRRNGLILWNSFQYHPSPSLGFLRSFLSGDSPRKLNRRTHRQILSTSAQCYDRCKAFLWKV